MKLRLTLFLLLLICFGASFSQTSRSLNSQLLIPVGGLHVSGKGQLVTVRHGFHVRRTSRRSTLPVKKIVPAKHITSFRRTVKPDRALLEYQGTNMGFEIRKYLHRHKLAPKHKELSSFSSATGKVPASGYYVGTDIFDQFAENPAYGVLPDYSTTGMFGSYSYKDKTYLTFKNAFGARLEIGYRSLKKYGLVFDFGFKAGFQYVDGQSDFKLPANGSDQYGLGKHGISPEVLPSILCSAMIGWTE